MSCFFHRTQKEDSPRGVSSANSGYHGFIFRESITAGRIFIVSSGLFGTLQLFQLLKSPKAVLGPMSIYGKVNQLESRVVGREPRGWGYPTFLLRRELRSSGVL